MTPTPHRHRPRSRSWRRSTAAPPALARRPGRDRSRFQPAARPRARTATADRSPTPAWSRPDRLSSRHRSIRCRRASLAVGRPSPMPARSPAPPWPALPWCRRPIVGPAPVAAPAPVEAPARPVPTNLAPSAAPEALTAAGLTRRTPLAARAQEAATVAPTRSASRTTRSPEEVRRMLSRYRSGLDRGRTLPSDEASQPTNGSDAPDTPTRGAQE